LLCEYFCDGVDYFVVGCVGFDVDVWCGVYDGGVVWVVLVGVWYVCEVGGYVE
jgi:hypothetical protein